MASLQWISVLAVILLAISCRKVEKVRPIPSDSYRAPYLPSDLIIASDPDASDSPDIAAGESRLHPAARERAYPFQAATRLASDDFEREVLEWMAEPKKGPAVLERVSRAGARGRQVVRKALRCEDRSVRMQACLVFGNLKGRLGKDDVSALADAVLFDPDPDVRATAAKAFVALRTPEAVPALIRSLNEDPYAAARANSAWALGQIGGKGAVEVLRKALRDEDTWVRLRAVTALGRLRAREAITDLAALEKDPNSMVRERAREVLRSLGKN